MYDYNPIINFAHDNECELFKNYQMSKITSFKIGGQADVLIKIHTKKILSAFIKKCNQLKIPFVVLGNCSNVLVSDDGIRGIVVKLCGEFNELTLEKNSQIKCGAGVSLAKLCSFAYANSLSGLEFAWGIPGSVGGAVFMNAGAYGGEMKDVLISCEHIDNKGNVGTFNNSELELGYRKSIYSNNFFTIVSLTVELSPGDKKEIKSKMDELMSRRKQKQPLEMPSAGSIFKRPQGNYAGTLIQDCGLKGFQVGGAMVSPKHGNFIVNFNNATCNDVLSLISKIQSTVYEKKGIRLECEVKTLGPTI